MSSWGQRECHPLLVKFVLSVWYYPYIVQFESFRQEDWLGQASDWFPMINSVMTVNDGRFGAGIYTSSTSSKSNDYSSNIKPSRQKAILLNKVVVGKGYKMTQDNTRLTAPPPGYDSVCLDGIIGCPLGVNWAWTIQVLAEVALGGTLNYDELVCYAENAIRPSYLLIYDA